MDLFDSGADDDREFAELKQPANPSQAGQSRLQAIIAIIGAIILVVLLVLLGRFIYHKVNNSSAQNVSGTSKVTVQQPAKPSNQSPSNSKPGSPSSNSSTGSSSSSSSSPTKTTVTGTLPNNGPGNVTAIFAGTSLAATGLHYIITLRRFNKSRA